MYSGLFSILYDFVIARCESTPIEAIDFYSSYPYSWLLLVGFFYSSGSLLHTLNKHSSRVYLRRMIITNNTMNKL